jgi:hypothetical protein
MIINKFLWNIQRIFKLFHGLCSWMFHCIKKGCLNFLRQPFWSVCQLLNLHRNGKQYFMVEGVILDRFHVYSVNLVNIHVVSLVAQTVG